MDSIWQAIKVYFGDGYTPHSSPFRFNVHLCCLKAEPQDRVSHGEDTNGDMMSLALQGPSYPPSCSCNEMEELVKHIDNFIQTFPGQHVSDYAFHTGKGDRSFDEVCLYAMRDALQFWSYWYSTAESHYWSLVYVAICAILDDVTVPPQDLISGSLRFLGHSLSDVWTGLRSEKVDPDDIKFMEMCLWRASVVQYLEKIDPELRARLISKPSIMTQFRTATANTHGYAVAILAAWGAKSLGPADKAVELSSISQLLALDLAKETLGVLQGENTETVAGNRHQRKCELRWMYARCLESFESQPNAHMLRRYASAALYYVPVMDRYLERVNHSRFPLSAEMRSTLNSYMAALT